MNFLRVIGISPVVLLFMSGVVFGASAPPSIQLVENARSQIGITVSYDPEYRSIPYPNGDVLQSTGVCTDVVIRAMRKLGLDLQQEVHKDMKKHFAQYPRLWGLKSTDRNIDHRRVPNLKTYMTRRGWSIPSSQDPQNYQPGDVVVWKLSSGIPHIGIVSDKKSSEKIPLIIHNIGQGTREEEGLFAFEITGHFRPKWPTCTPHTQPAS